MSDNKKLNVIIVDDEPLVTIFLQRVVTYRGHTVIDIYDNSADALQYIPSKSPDLIFMDINIIGPLDGISVIKKLQIDSKVSIIFISSYDESEIVDEALSTNPTNYLIKPIQEESLKIALSLVEKEFNKPKNNPSPHLYLSDNIYYDFTINELVQRDMSFTLSNIEKKLIDLFVKKYNSNLSLEQIKKSVWTQNDVSDSTVRDAISHLRKKVPLLPLETNFGRGYMLKINNSN